VGWRNLFQTVEKSSSIPRAELWREIVFGVTYELRVNYKIAHRNRYLEGRIDRQMTPRGNPYFNSYMKNLRVLVFITDGRTRTETLIWCGLPSLHSSRLKHYSQGSSNHVKNANTDNHTLIAQTQLQRKILIGFLWL
jgi:hypothetical protein